MSSTPVAIVDDDHATTGSKLGLVVHAAMLPDARDPGRAGSDAVMISGASIRDIG